MRLLFTNKNSDFGTVPVTECCWAGPVSKVESHIADRCSYRLLYCIAFCVGPKSYSVISIYGGTYIAGRTRDKGDCCPRK